MGVQTPERIVERLETRERHAGAEAEGIRGFAGVARGIVLGALLWLGILWLVR